jgi:hypothetical protein
MKLSTITPAPATFTPVHFTPVHIIQRHQTVRVYHTSDFSDYSIFQQRENGQAAAWVAAMMFRMKC